MIEQSPTIDKIAPAFVAAQAACNGAKKGSNNPHFKSKYADLSQVWAACEDALEANGLAVVQGLGEASDGVMHMDTMLLHTSGQWMRSHASIPLPKGDPQGYGSATTYLRRYALAAMIGIVQEDDDGNAARAPANDSTTARSDPPTRAAKKLDGPYTSPSALKAAYHDLDRDIRGCGDMDELNELLAKPETIALIEQMKRDARGYVFGSDKLPPEHEPLMALISRIQAELNAPTFLNAG